LGVTGWWCTAGSPGGLASALSAQVAAHQPGRGQRLVLVDPTGPGPLRWGDQDRVIDRSVIDGLVSRRPDWTLRVLPGVGHVLPMEVPDRTWTW
jgi:hypothetical protein